MGRRVRSETDPQPRLVVVTGVAGAGKSHIGRALAARLSLAYRDGDDFHSETNITKMAGGVALGDEDRGPWLRAIAVWLRAHRDVGAVVSCSALRRSYRDQLRALEPGLCFLYLAADRELIRARVAARREHFMPASLIDSQFAILEPLAADEPGVTVDARRTPEEIIAELLAHT